MAIPDSVAKVESAVVFQTPPRRVVVRAPNWLGDAVMSMPALQRLKERFADAHLTVITHEKLAGLWHYHPAIDQVVTFNSDQSVFSLGHRLKEGRYDLAVIFPNSPRSALEAWIGGVPRRLGYRRPWGDWLLTDKLGPRPGHVTMHKRSVEEVRSLVANPGGKKEAEVHPRTAHQVFDLLHLVAALGADPALLAPRLEVPAAAAAAVARRIGLELDEKGRRQRLFGLNPGAEYGPAKRWPADRFVAAARQIQSRTGCRWLVFGGPGDVSRAAEISAGIQSEVARPSPLNVAGKTSLAELCALIRLCDVFLTNDTGPMHLAAAVGTPVVAPFGSTSPELTGPGLPGDTRHRVLTSDAACTPCFLRECPIDFRCMLGITVERVVEAVLGVVNRPDGP